MLMGLKKGELKKVAELSNIPLSRQELDELAPQLEEVVNHFGHLSEVKVAKISPTSQTTGLENIYRDDVVENCFSQEEATSQSKKIHNGYFITSFVFKIQ